MEETLLNTLKNPIHQTQPFVPNFDQRLWNKLQWNALPSIEVKLGRKVEQSLQNRSYNIIIERYDTPRYYLVRVTLLRLNYQTIVVNDHLGAFDAAENVSMGKENEKI